MKKLLGIVVLGLLWCTNSFSQNCDPNQYNDGIQLKDAEKEWNYSGEEAYAFGRKIQDSKLSKLVEKQIKNRKKTGLVNYVLYENGKIVIDQSNYNEEIIKLYKSINK